MNEGEAGQYGEEAGAVIRTAVRQPKPWREPTGPTLAEFGAAIGCGEELVPSVERGSGFLGRTIRTARMRHWRRAAGPPR